MPSKYLFAPLIVSAFFLTSCGAPDTPATTTINVSKTPYIVDIFVVGKNTANVTVEKTGRITASSSLTLSAQGVGEVNKVYVKEWQNVRAGALIATLKDTQNNYDLRYSQAQNALRIQDASIETTRLNLSQAVDNARITLERAKQSYATLTGKNALSYDTLVNTNSKTLDAYNETYKTYLSDAERLMTQLLYEGDKILGMTNNYKYQAEAWKPYLGAQIGNTRVTAENEWNNTYSVRWDIRALIEKAEKNKIDPINPQTSLDIVTKAYSQSRTYVDAMLTMLQNNAIGWPLWPEMNTGWNAAWNGQRGSVQASEAQYNAWKAQTISFFKGYKNNESATQLALMSLSRNLTPDEQTLINSSADLKVTYENTRLDIKDKVENARLAVEQAQKAYTTAQELQRATINQLSASRESSRLSLLQAERDYAKLRISAPVDGIISKVIASVGQTVTMGSPITEFTGKQPQVVIDIDPSLATTLAVGDSVSVQAEERYLTGTITARSTVANANLLSTVRIAVPGAESYIGKSVKILFWEKNTSQNSNTSRIVLPIDAIKIISEGEWEIAIFSGSEMKKQTVKIGQVLGDTIELVEPIADGSQVILTDMSNYDPLKNTLQKKTK